MGILPMILGREGTYRRGHRERGGVSHGGHGCSGGTAYATPERRTYATPERRTYATAERRTARVNRTMANCFRLIGVLPFVRRYVAFMLAYRSGLVKNR